MDKKRVLIIALVLILVPLALAGYNKGNPAFNLVGTYPQYANVSGWINMSFDNEPSDSLFAGNYGGQIKLMELLDENDINYTCQPLDCEPQYTTDNGAETKEFPLSQNSKYISLKINGNFKNIASNGIDIKIQGTNAETCANPLRIDILDDGTNEFTASNYSTDFSCRSGSGYGCFDQTSGLSETEIAETPYCNKINLTEGNAYELGAWIKKGSNAMAWSEGLLNLELYDDDGDFVESCSFTNSPTISGGEMGCRINYTNPQLKTHYLCISAKESSSGYTTRYETNNACGFFDNPPSTNYAADYQLSASGAKFGNTGIIPINETSFEESGNAGTLTDYISDYIETRYDSNCTDGCVIPIKLTSEGQITAKVISASLKYQTNIGIIETKAVYDSEKRPSRISIGYKKLNIDPAGFQLPTTFGNTTFRLNYKGIELLSKSLEVKKAPVIRSLWPNATAAFQRTLFTATVINALPNTTIIYKWDFGDDTTAETKNNTVVHAYEEIGEYEITLTITDSKGNTNSKAFTVNVENPKTIINKTIADYKKNLNKIQSNLSQMPSWQSAIIKSELELNESEKIVADAEREYIAALSSDDDDAFIDIMSALYDIYVPQDIRTREKATGLPVTIDESLVSLDNLEEISGADYPESPEEAIADWDNQNLDIFLDSQTISGYQNLEATDLLRIYKIRVNPINQNLGKVYLIIDNSEVVFGPGNSPIEKEGYYGIVFESLEQARSVELAMSDDSKLSFYFAPEPSLLGIEPDKPVSPCNFNNVCEAELDEDSSNCPSDCGNLWTGKIIAVVVVLVVAVIIYIIMMWWYRNRYEGHLFKNKRDELNILAFISRAKKSGIEDDKIVESLEKAGWKGEQIDYAMKKWEEEN